MLAFASKAFGREPHSSQRFLHPGREKARLEARSKMFSVSRLALAPCRRGHSDLIFSAFASFQLLRMKAFGHSSGRHFHLPGVGLPFASLAVSTCASRAAFCLRYRPDSMSPRRCRGPSGKLGMRRVLPAMGTSSSSTDKSEVSLAGFGGNAFLWVFAWCPEDFYFEAPSLSPY